MAQPIPWFQRRTPTQLLWLALCGGLALPIVFLAKKFLWHTSGHLALALIISIILAGGLLDWAAEAHLKRGVNEGWWKAESLEKGRRQNARMAYIFMPASAMILVAWLISLCFFGGHFTGLFVFLFPAQVVSRVERYLRRPHSPVDRYPDWRDGTKPIASDQWGEAPSTR